MYYVGCCISNRCYYYRMDRLNFLGLNMNQILPTMKQDRDYVRWTDITGKIHQSGGIIGGTASTAIYNSKIASGTRKVTLHMYGRGNPIRSYHQPITL